MRALAASDPDCCGSKRGGKFWRSADRREACISRRSLMIEAASATKRRFAMKSHCRLVLILGIAYSLLALLSNTAQTKVKSADEARAAQINERSERGLGVEFCWYGDP